MAKFVKTMELSGNQYAKVAERLVEFRKENPRASIKTTPEFLEDGDVHFTAYIIKDKGDENSADATGHSYGKKDKQKAFEKLETIAVGRALALLGYAASGEIASSEEMEEFEEYKENQKQEAIIAWTEKLGDAKDLKELASVWTEVPGEIKPDVLQYKNDLKKRFSEPLLPLPDTHPEVSELPDTHPAPRKKKTEQPNTENHEDN